jgi:hypothetical protein
MSFNTTLSLDLILTSKELQQPQMEMSKPMTFTELPKEVTPPSQKLSTQPATALSLLIPMTLSRLSPLEEEQELSLSFQAHLDFQSSLTKPLKLQEETGLPILPHTLQVVQFHMPQKKLKLLPVVL